MKVPIIPPQAWLGAAVRPGHSAAHRPVALTSRRAVPWPRRSRPHVGSIMRIRSDRDLSLEQPLLPVAGVVRGSPARFDGGRE